MRRINPLKEAPLLRLAVCLMAGIVVGDAVSLPLLPLLAGLAVLVLVALLTGRWPLVQTALIGLCFVVLGVLLTERQRQQLAVDWPDGEVTAEAVVLTAPQEKPKTMAVDILLAGSGRKLKCYLHKDSRSRLLRVGDGIRLQTVIRPNSDWRRGTFNYRRYLEVHGFSGSAYVASWNWQKTQVSLRSFSRLDRTRLFFLKQRSRLLSRMRSGGLADDAYAVVAAMTLGDKSALSADLKEVYSQTGASHVLALSGLHLGIIYALLSLLVAGRRWRLASQVLTVAAVWAFVLLTGLSVSVVRAAVMLTVYALLSLGRRENMSVNTLAFTALVMLIASPNALFDVGFQLSYMAVLSILLFMPIFERLVSPQFLMSHRAVKWGWGLVSVSLAAQLGVAPLVAYYFGRFSCLFLLTNFIVIPATTLVLYLSLVVLAVPSLAFLLLYIVDWLNRMLAVVAALPGATVEGLHPSVLQVAMMYVVLTCGWLLAEKLGKVFGD